MRVYIPATVGLVRSWHAAQAVEPVDGVAFGVTAGLREWYVDDDAEELEYAATLLAARASVQLLAVRGGADPDRRAVLAADVEDGAAAPSDEPVRGALQLSGPVAWAQVACALLDDPADAATAAAVAAARAALVGVGLAGGLDVAALDDLDDDTGYLLDATADADLAWWATQEVGLAVDAPAGLTGPA